MNQPQRQQPMPAKTNRISSRWNSQETKFPTAPEITNAPEIRRTSSANCNRQDAPRRTVTAASEKATSKGPPHFFPASNKSEVIINPLGCRNLAVSEPVPVLSAPKSASVVC